MNAPLPRAQLTPPVFATQAEACKFYGVAMRLEPSLVIAVLRERGNKLIEERDACAEKSPERIAFQRELMATIEQWKRAHKLAVLRQRPDFDPDDRAEIRRELRSR